MTITTTIPYRFVVKRGTAANFTAANTLLLQGEWALETDTGKLKMGDGVTAWNSLAYVTTDKIPEGTTNKYYTDERAQDAVAAMIAAGTHSGISFAYDDANNKISATVSGGGSGGGALTYMATATVSGSAATSLAFSGLDLATDQEYWIDFFFKNATASSCNIRLTFNSDTTNANYHINLATAGPNANLVTGYTNDPRIGGMAGSNTVQGRIVITRDLNGHPAAFAQTLRAASTAGILAQYGVHSWTGTANVTSIALSSDVASTLAVGSYCKLFKLVG